MGEVVVAGRVLKSRPDTAIDGRREPETKTVDWLIAGRGDSHHELLARRSAAMDFDEADEIDDNELNSILWLALKGSEPPTPTRSFFGK